MRKGVLFLLPFLIASVAFSHSLENVQVYSIEGSSGKEVIPLPGLQCRALLENGSVFLAENFFITRGKAVVFVCRSSPHGGIPPLNCSNLEPIEINNAEFVCKNGTLLFRSYFNQSGKWNFLSYAKNLKLPFVALFSGRGFCDPGPHPRLPGFVLAYNTTLVYLEDIQNYFGANRQGCKNTGCEFYSYSWGECGKNYVYAVEATATNASFYRNWMKVGEVIYGNSTATRNLGFSLRECSRENSSYIIDGAVILENSTLAMPDRLPLAGISLKNPRKFLLLLSEVPLSGVCNGTLLKTTNYGFGKRILSALELPENCSKLYVFRLPFYLQKQTHANNGKEIFRCTENCKSAFILENLPAKIRLVGDETNFSIDLVAEDDTKLNNTVVTLTDLGTTVYVGNNSSKVLIAIDTDKIFVLFEWEKLNVLKIDPGFNVISVQFFTNASKVFLDDAELSLLFLNSTDEHLNYTVSNVSGFFTVSGNFYPVCLWCKDSATVGVGVPPAVTARYWHFYNFHTNKSKILITQRLQIAGCFFRGKTLRLTQEDIETVGPFNISVPKLGVLNIGWGNGTFAEIFIPETNNILVKYSSSSSGIRKNCSVKLLPGYANITFESDSKISIQGRDLFDCLNTSPPRGKIARIEVVVDEHYPLLCINPITDPNVTTVLPVHRCFPDFNSSSYLGVVGFSSPEFMCYDLWGGVVEKQKYLISGYPNTPSINLNSPGVDVFDKYVGTKSVFPVFKKAEAGEYFFLFQTRSCDIEERNGDPCTTPKNESLELHLALKPGVIELCLGNSTNVLFLSELVESGLRCRKVEEGCYQVLPSATTFLKNVWEDHILKVYLEPIDIRRTIEFEESFVSWNVSRLCVEVEEVVERSSGGSSEATSAPVVIPSPSPITEFEKNETEKSKSINNTGIEDYHGVSGAFNATFVVEISNETTRGGLATQENTTSAEGGVGLKFSFPLLFLAFGMVAVLFFKSRWCRLCGR